MAQQKEKNEAVLKEIGVTVDRISKLRRENVEGYKEFEKKREELEEVVQKLERTVNTADDDDNLDDDDDDMGEITQEQAEQQEEEHIALQEKREMMEHKLRLIRGQIAHVQNEMEETQSAVNEVRVKTGRDAIDWTAICSLDDVVKVKESVDKEVQEMKVKIDELKNSNEFYGGMRELMEELGGVYILETVKNDNHEKEGFCLKLMLLGSHILELTLEPGGEDASLCVGKAELLTSASLPVPKPNEETKDLTETLHSISVANLSFSKIMSQKQAEAVTIPPLDDLVSYSHNLESSHAIRFVVSETLARIRTVQARALELTRLTHTYAAKIYDVESGQEVVCALNEGVSIAMRLGADCPGVRGSVYISELCGVGGWEENKLEELKQFVSDKRCRGPVEVMEVLVEEIGRRMNEDGWKLPLTPVLIRGGGGMSD